MSSPPNIGEPINTANVMITPSTIPIIANRLFINYRLMPLIKRNWKNYGKDLEDYLKGKIAKLLYGRS